MSIVLQHQFWDLEVDDSSFAVTLMFDGRRQSLRVPFDALLSFVDPEAQFGFQFTELNETAGQTANITDPGGDSIPKTGRADTGNMLRFPGRARR